ncbi:unnamed protein product [Protopolystoma xenopodis]|uniref:Uncharacterized protein n=1 Tax=Protopolystoma xenopodis TaxID=117903 RepID=A0A448WK50_9PLAT|nr:unnamed protein product [Protopolystoma xenopodis]
MSPMMWPVTILSSLPTRHEAPDPFLMPLTNDPLQHSSLLLVPLQPQLVLLYRLLRVRRPTLYSSQSLATFKNFDLSQSSILLPLQ